MRKVKRASTILLVGSKYKDFKKSMSKNKIGLKIRQLRKKAGISQDKLSKNADVALNTIVKIESQEQQNPTIETLKKIAAGLGVPIGDLIS